MSLESSPEEPVPVRTVSRALADYIARLGAIWMDGQVAEFRYRQGMRFQYFTLRDTDVEMSLSVRVDAAALGRLDPPLTEGQRVLVWAKPDFYAARGSLSMIAREVRTVGLGALLAELARLRDLLAAEGLFAADRKRPLPFLPRRVGLICGRNSAAMQDVLANARDRWPSVEFEIREVAVQGPQAVSAVTSALTELDAVSDVDVIIVTRGGGSVEDLLPFSNETMVRAAAACTTPIVSAIGHEQDAPLLDLVADLRASTPTDAAKRVVPSLVEQSALVDGLYARALRVLSHRLDSEVQTMDHGVARARSIVLSRLDAAATDVMHLQARVRVLSPAATLERGYAIVLNDQGAIVRDAEQVATDSLLDIRLAQGRMSARREG